MTTKIAQVRGLDLRAELASKFLLLNFLSQIENEKLQIQTICTNHLKEIHDLKKEINDLKTSIKHSDHIIANLKKQSVLKTEHDQLIAEMKKKAEQFEQFMRDNDNSPNTPPTVDRSAVSLRDQCVSTEDLVNNNDRSSSDNTPSIGSTEYRALEKRIREEMAKVTAQQIKDYQNQIKEEEKRFKEQMKLASEELDQAQIQIQLRDRDISALKQCIISERATFQEELQKKDHEAETALERQNNMLVRSRDQLLAAHQKIDQLSRELDDALAQNRINYQRINQWNDERKNFISQEEQLKQRMVQMRADFDASSKALNEKIIKAKRTAASYKQYAKDQDEHIVQETERLKKQCELNLQKMKDSLNEKEKQLNLKFERLKAKYDASSNNNSDRNHVTSSSSMSSK